MSSRIREGLPAARCCGGGGGGGSGGIGSDCGVRFSCGKRHLVLSPAVCQQCVCIPHPTPTSPPSVHPHPSPTSQPSTRPVLLTACDIAATSSPVERRQVKEGWGMSCVGSASETSRYDGGGLPAIYRKVRWIHSPFWVPFGCTRHRCYMQYRLTLPWSSWTRRFLVMPQTCPFAAAAAVSSLSSLLQPLEKCYQHKHQHSFAGRRCHQRSGPPRYSCLRGAII